MYVVHVCMIARVYVCMYVCMYALYVCMYVCMDVCMNGTCECYVMSVCAVCMYVRARYVCM